MSRQAINISAIVTAHNRTEQTLETLKRIYKCQPHPNEVLVHVDDNQLPLEIAIQQEFPEVKVILSESCIGPGGGRNKLVAAAINEFIASFDDDSFPLDCDYFARVHKLFDKFPTAAIVGAQIYHQGETIAPESRTAAWVSDFSGGACAYRRDVFLGATGYVPLPVAYGMEEVDFALRLHARGGKILRTSWLRVFHDTDLSRHSDPRVTAASIANLALLAYLRYPPIYWPIGIIQCLNRILWLLTHGRSRGVLSGMIQIPSHLRAHHPFRQPLDARSVRSYLALRRSPTPVSME